MFKINVNPTEKKNTIGLKILQEPNVFFFIKKTIKSLVGLVEIYRNLTGFYWN